MTSPLRRVKKKLSRCEKFLADGVRAAGAGDPDRMERRLERDFVGPLRDLVAVLRRGGMSLPPRELARLARLESIASRADDRPTVVEELVGEIVAAWPLETGTGTDTAVVGGDGPPLGTGGDFGDVDPALVAALLAGPTGP